MESIKKSVHNYRRKTWGVKITLPKWWTQIHSSRKLRTTIVQSWNETQKSMLTKIFAPKLIFEKTTRKIAPYLDCETKCESRRHIFRAKFLVLYAAPQSWTMEYAADTASNSMHYWKLFIEHYKRTEINRWSPFGSHQAEPPQFAHYEHLSLLIR